ncbi:MAG: DUF6119 family protein [Frankiaceae bacterium]
MPQQSSAARTSLYRLLGISDLATAVQKKYLDRTDFTATKTTVAGHAALLVAGTMRTDTVKWGSTLQALTNEQVSLGNRTAAAVLIIADPPDAWVLAYGMGFQLLDQTKVDSGFGQRIAIRAADPAELNSLTRTTLDHRPRTDRFSIPSGDNLRVFGVGDFGELVTRLVGKATISHLTGGAKPLRIRGADALSIPLGRKPDELMHDLAALSDLLQQSPPAELAVLEQLVAIKKRPDLTKLLEDDLLDAFATPTVAKLGLSWPHERIDENGTPSSFKIFGAGRKAAKVQDGIPNLESVLQPITSAQPTARAALLDSMRIQLFRDADGEEPISPAIPLRKWLAFETDRDGKRYCLHDGNWYLMNQDYAEKLKKRTEAIFARDPGIKLPEWPAGQNEGEYNNLAAKQLGGVLLDKQLIRTELHRRGIEACDILTSDGVFIHVKDLSASAPASHLLAQALVSADALLHDAEARDKLRAKVTERGGDPSWVPDTPRRVVLGMARTGTLITSAQLFTFTQVTLVRHVAALEARRVEVFVVPISRPV